MHPLFREFGAHLKKLGRLSEDRYRHSMSTVDLPHQLAINRVVICATLLLGQRAQIH